MNRLLQILGCVALLLLNVLLGLCIVRQGRALLLRPDPETPQSVAGRYMVVISTGGLPLRCDTVTGQIWAMNPKPTGDQPRWLELWNE